MNPTRPIGAGGFTKRGLRARSVGRMKILIIIIIIIVTVIVIVIVITTTVTW